jgi:hypothetical protein
MNGEAISDYVLPPVHTIDYSVLGALARQKSTVAPSGSQWLFSIGLAPDA